MEQTDKYRSHALLTLLPALCFLPLFHGVFPLFALDILILLNLSLSSNSSESSLEDSSWIVGRLELAPTCETSQPFRPFSSWTKPLVSRVATALIQSLPLRTSSCLTLKNSSLGMPKDFQAQGNLFSFAKVNEVDDSLPWIGFWALCIHKWIWKAGCTAAISAKRHKNNRPIISKYHQEGKQVQSVGIIAIWLNPPFPNRLR